MNRIPTTLFFIFLSFSPTAFAEETAEKLFDGKSLAGWACISGAPITGWSVKNQELVSSPDARALVSVDKFENFDFECDFQLDAKESGSVYLRGRYEVRLLDDPSYPKAPANEKCGSIFQQLAPTKSSYRPGQWNNLKIRLVDKIVTVKLNDTMVIERKQIRNLSRGAFNQNEQNPGPILLQSQGCSIRFKNLTIRRING